MRRDEGDPALVGALLQASGEALSQQQFVSRDGDQAQLPRAGEGGVADRPHHHAQGGIERRAGEGHGDRVAQCRAALGAHTAPGPGAPGAESGPRPGGARPR